VVLRELRLANRQVAVTVELVELARRRCEALGAVESFGVVLQQSRQVYG